MRAFRAAEVLKVAACKDDHLEVTGRKVISPFLALLLKKLVCSWELVVTNCLCRMMGKLERDGFGEAHQILYKLLLHWRHTYYIRYSRSSCQIWALSVFVPGNIQGQAIAGSPGAYPPRYTGVFV